MPRVLVLRPGPSFSVADVCRGWTRAFVELGCETVDVNFDDRLNFYTAALIEKDGELISAVSTKTAFKLALHGVAAAAYECWPDIVFIVSGFYIPPGLMDLFRKRGHTVVLLCTESPYEDDRQLADAEHVDLVVLNDPTNLDRFTPITKTVYIPHAYDPEVHRPGNADLDIISEFAFVGTGYQSRIEFLEAVDWSGIDVTIAGNWNQLTEQSPLRPFVAHPLDECVANDETVRLYQSTLTSANLYRREAERVGLEAGWAMGPREVELAACGTWFARDPRGEGDTVFPMLPTFTTPAELGDQIRWALAHPDERETATQQARAAIADRTFTNHAAELLRLL